MSLGTCLTDLRDRGLISAARFDALRPVYDELVMQYESRFGREAAESMATAKALELAESEALERSRRVLLQARRQGAWEARMKLAQTDKAPVPRAAAEQFLVDMDGQRRAIRQQGLQLLFGLLAKHRRDLVGRVRNKSELGNVLAELWGRDSGDLNAREIARAWRETSEMLRSRFNAAGGHIGKLEAWRLPQRHDMRQVREAGFEGWRDFMLPLLDRSAMIDRATGEAMSDGKLELLLRDMWSAIATDGWSRNAPGALFEGATANRRADHRVLHFAGPDEWTAYAARFGGGGTAFDAMLAHVEGMARDIAAMEAMGPNPAATLAMQKDWLAKAAETALLDGRGGAKASDEASAGAHTLQNLYDTYTGEAYKPVRRRVALGFSAFKAQQTAAKLGSAMLSTPGDWGTMVTTARFNGVPAAKVMARYASMMNPRNVADRAQAARHVLMADQWADGHATQWRMLGEEIAHEGMRRLSTGVLRSSGLTAHTDIARQAFAMETVAEWTHQGTHAFGNIDPKFRALLQRYGIGETEWDVMRTTAPDTYKGTDWLYPQTLAAAGHQAIADNLMRLLVTEADFAVPTPDLRTRATLATKFKKGDWIGESLGTVFLFKGFPITMINMHGRRMLEQGTRAEAAAGFAGILALRYGLTLLAYTTLGGAIALQAKEIVRGRDPMPMDDARFWGAALAQGGGLGILGDFLYSLTNRFSDGLGTALAGPAVQAIDNTIGAAARNTLASLDGDEETESRWKKDLAKAVMSETPGISLWYARGLIERTFGDMTLEWAYGEDIGEHYRKLDRQAQERGTSYYAPPGLGVQRMPNFGNALGQPSEEDVAIELGRLD